MKCYQDPELQHAYEMGCDAAVHPTTKNCHFQLFSTRDKMLAWQEGNLDAGGYRRRQ